MLVSAAAIGVTFFLVGIPFASFLATWFSNAQLANLERQTAKLQRSRARIQKRRGDRDQYDARQALVEISQTRFNGNQRLSTLFNAIKQKRMLKGVETR